MTKTTKARTLPSSLPNALPARRRGERCGGEALTHGDARIVKALVAQERAALLYHA
jgi:hypothetical protein